MKTKKSWEMLTGSAYLIKHNIKVGKLIYSFIDSSIENRLEKFYVES